MPDIVLCRDHSCGKKSHCYRYNAEPSAFRQPYFAHSPRDPLTGHCDWFSAVTHDPAARATETALMDGRA